MKKKLFFCGTFIVIATITLVFGSFIKASDKKETSYITATVTRGDIIQRVSATGTLQAINTVEVGSQISGTIEKIFVDYNSTVKAGQVLAQIDPSTLEAAVLEAQATLDSAVAALTEAEAKDALARKNYERKKKLLEQDFIAQSDVDEAYAEWQSAKAAVASAKASIKGAKAALEKAKRNLTYATIKSPVSGVVIDKAVSEGQTVAASLEAPTLFTIAEDLTNMQVEVTVDEADIGQVKEGQIAKFFVDSFPEETYFGKVRQIRLSPTEEENVVTYTVIVDVQNPQLKLLPGMTANVTIEIASAKNVLKVPSAALTFSPQDSQNNTTLSTYTIEPSHVIWVLDEGKPKPIKVNVGLSDGNFTEITGDVEEGQIVILSSSATSTTSNKRTPMRFFP